MEFSDQVERVPKTYEIIFDINKISQRSFGGFTAVQYLRLKSNSKFAYYYLKREMKDKFVPDEDGNITIYRSIDGLDFEPIDFDPAAPQNYLWYSDERLQDALENFNDKSVPLTSLFTRNEISNYRNICIDVESNSQGSLPSTAKCSEKVDCGNKQQNSNNSALSNLDINASSTITSSPRVSVIHGHCTEIIKKGAGYWLCKYCSTEIKKSGNTTNMINHLKLHPTFFDYKSKKQTSNPNKTSTQGTLKRLSTEKENSASALPKKPCPDRSQDSTQPTITTAFKYAQSFKNGGSNSEKLTSALTFMICKDLQPFNTVEREGFNFFVITACPLYKIPSANTITSRIEKKYELLKKVVVQKLHLAESYSFTADNWTDDTNYAYTGITVHFLNEESRMETACLGAIPLYEDHTSDYLEKRIRDAFSEFEIDIDKISGMVTDGEKAIVAAVKAIVGAHRHSICATHNASHIIPDAASNNEKLKTLFAKTNNIVKKIRRSGKASRGLKKLQEDDPERKGNILRLKQDVKCRFTSTIDSIERYILLEKYMHAAMLKCPEPIDVLNLDEVKILNEILPIMKPVREFITVTSAEKHPTSSLVIPLTRCMRLAIEAIQPTSTIAKDFKDRVLQSIVQRFGNITNVPLYANSCLLDPRFKKMHFEKGNVTNALNNINKMLKSADEKSLAENSSSISSNNLSQTDNSKKKPSNSIWEIHDQLQKPPQTYSQAQSSRDPELEHYIGSPILDRHVDVFLYWKDAQLTSPRLAKLARRYSPVLASTIPSERLFSRAGLIKCDNRSNLNSTHLNMLVFLSYFKSTDWS